MGTPVFSFSQLQNVQTIPAAIDELKTILTGSGFTNITSWLPGTYQYSLLYLAAFLYTQGQQQAATLALNAIEATASGDFLTAIASSFFNNQRASATQTVGTVQLNLAIGTGPYNLTPGQLTINFTAPNNVQYQFTNLNSFSIANVANPVSPATSLQQVQAVLPGSGPSTVLYGITGSINGFPGLTATIPFNGSFVQGWQNQLGTDTQIDASLHNLNQTKWSTLVSGETTQDRIRYIINSASNGVLFDTYVNATNPQGPGTIDVYSSNATSVASAFQLSQVSGSVQALFMNGGLDPISNVQRVRLLAATPVVFGTSINTNVQIFYSQNTTQALIDPQVQSTINGWIATIPTGGNSFSSTTTNIADIDDLISLLYLIQGVAKVKITNQSDIPLGSPIWSKLVAPASYSSILTYTQVPASFL